LSKTNAPPPFKLSNASLLHHIATFDPVMFLMASVIMLPMEFPS
jgi:hypothetical protein